MKKLIKLFLTLFNCIIFRMPYKKDLYIGYGAKIVGKNIKIG